LGKFSSRLIPASGPADVKSNRVLAGREMADPDSFIAKQKMNLVN